MERSQTSQQPQFRRKQSSCIPGQQRPTAWLQRWWPSSRLYLLQKPEMGLSRADGHSVIAHYRLWRTAGSQQCNDSPHSPTWHLIRSNRCESESRCVCRCVEGIGSWDWGFEGFGSLWWVDRDIQLLVHASAQSSQTDRVTASDDPHNPFSSTYHLSIFSERAKSRRKTYTKCGI